MDPFHDGVIPSPAHFSRARDLALSLTERLSPREILRFA
jgi:hypothetical protein